MADLHCFIIFTKTNLVSIAVLQNCKEKLVDLERWVYEDCGEMSPNRLLLCLVLNSAMLLLVGPRWT